MPSSKDRQRIEIPVYLYEQLAQIAETEITRSPASSTNCCFKLYRLIGRHGYPINISAASTSVGNGKRKRYYAKRAKTPGAG